MQTLNNPAGRLFSIIKAAKSYKKQDQVAKQAWAEVLEMDSNDLPLLLKRIGSLIELPNIISKEISQYSDINQNIYLKWLPKVRRGFMIMNFEVQFRAFTDPIDEAAIDGLEFCSDLLSRRSPERVLDDNELRSIYNDTKGLIESIICSNLDENLKNIMVEKLNEILTAIQEYKIKGSRPIEKVVESTIGQIVISKDVYEKTKTTEFGSKFWEILSRVAIVVSIAVGTIQIGESIVKILPNHHNETIQSEDYQPYEIPKEFEVAIKTVG